MNTYRTCLAVALLFAASLCASPRAAWADLDDIVRAEDSVEKARKELDKAQADREKGDQEVREAQEALARREAEAASAKGELARLGELESARPALEGEYKKAWATHRDEPRDPANYEAVKSLQAKLGALDEEMTRLRSNRGANDEIMSALERDRPSLENGIAELREKARGLAEKEEAAREAFDEAQSAFEEAVERDPEAKEIRDTIRRADEDVKKVVDGIFDFVAEEVGEPDPSKDRTIGFSVEGRAEVPLFSVIEGVGGAKNHVYLTRKADGTYEVTVVSEANLGAQVKAADVGKAGIVGVARPRKVYKFDPEKSGDMVALATLFAAAGAAGTEGGEFLETAREYLDKLPDGVTRFAVEAMADGVSSVASASSDVAGFLGDVAGDIGLEGAQEALQGAAESLDDASSKVDEYTDDVVDFAIAFKHLPRSAEEHLYRERTDLGGRVEGKLDLGEKFLKLQGSAELSRGTERRIEDGQEVTLESWQVEYKGGADIGGVVGGGAEGVRQYQFKRQLDDEGNVTAVEVLVQTKGEAGAGLGPPGGPLKGRAGASTKEVRRFRLEGATEEDYERIVDSYLSDPAFGSQLDETLGEFESEGRDVESTTKEATGAFLKGEFDGKFLKAKGKIEVFDGFDSEMVGDGDSD